MSALHFDRAAVLLFPCEFHGQSVHRDPPQLLLPAIESRTTPVGHAIASTGHPRPRPSPCFSDREIPK
jgi:hypothetical protein